MTEKSIVEACWCVSARDYIQNIFYNCEVIWTAVFGKELPSTVRIATRSLVLLLAMTRSESAWLFIV